MVERERKRASVHELDSSMTAHMVCVLPFSWVDEWMHLRCNSTSTMTVKSGSREKMCLFVCLFACLLGGGVSHRCSFSFSFFFPGEGWQHDDDDDDEEAISRKRVNSRARVFKHFMIIAVCFWFDFCHCHRLLFDTAQVHRAPWPLPGTRAPRISMDMCFGEREPSRQAGDG